MVVETRAYDNVPHYRRKFDGRPTRRPQDARRSREISISTKADLRDTYPYGLFASPMRDIVRVHASSGTTGKPTVVGYTKEDISNWADLMARSCALRAAADDIILNSYGYGLFTGGLGAHYGGEWLGADRHSHVRRPDESRTQLIQDFKPPTVLLCARRLCFDHRRRTAAPGPGRTRPA